MKKIDVIIRPFELDSVKEVVCDLGIQGMTITDVRVPEEQGGKIIAGYSKLQIIPRSSHQN